MVVAFCVFMFWAALTLHETPAGIVGHTGIPENLEAQYVFDEMEVQEMGMSLKTHSVIGIYIYIYIYILVGCHILLFFS
jgi:hypothetical protein